MNGLLQAGRMARPSRYWNEAVTPLTPQPKPAVTVGSTTIAVTGDARMGVTGTIR